MRLLFDTHIWIWSVLDPDRLKAKVRKALRDPATELWLSPVSIWEFSLLIEKGRLRTSEPVSDWVSRSREYAGWRDAPLTAEVALESSRIRLPHRDPADRFLLATARVYDLTLVTADQVLLAAPGFDLLANR